MPQLKVYLCGSIQSASDSGEGWRKIITPKLEALGIKVLNPNKLEKLDIGHTAAATQKIMKNCIDKNDWGHFDSIMKTIQRRDFKAVKMSDFLIVYLDPAVKYGGTVAEIERARDMKIPIFAVCEKDLSTENFWVIYTIRDSDGVIFNSFDKLLEHVAEGVKNGEL